MTAAATGAGATATAARVAWAVVPVKCFDRAKSRLAEILPAMERAAFARTLCEHVLTVALACDSLAGVLVVTDCDAVSALAREMGAEAVIEPSVDSGGDPIASTIDRALVALQARGAAAAIVLMSDLPHLEAADIALLIARLDDHDVVLAPDLAGDGTNALALAPPTRMPTCFGHRDSFVRHLDRARRLGLRLDVVRRPALALDVDAPADYARFKASR